MSNEAQQTVTAANVLSGERSFRTVQFAITGDAETDLIAAIIAAMDSTNTPNSFTDSEARVRVLKYLIDRYQSRVESDRKQREMMERMQVPPIAWPGMGIGSGLAGAAAPAPMPYTTSGGSLNPALRDYINKAKAKWEHPKHPAIVSPCPNPSHSGEPCNGLHDEP